MDRFNSGLRSYANASSFLSTLGRCSIGAAVLIGLAPLAAMSQPLPERSAKDYSGINIFGDSLVDGGNFFNITQQLTGTGLPPAPYAQQFSNGDVWSQQLADALNLSPAQSSTVLPGILSGTAPLPTEGINFALGGSLSDDTGTQPGLPGLRSQITTFSALPPADPNALNVLLAGANDYNIAVSNPNVSPTALAALPDQVTDNLIDAIAGLINTGAEDILVSNLPNLGNQPLAQTLNQLNPQTGAGLTALSSQHNLLLAEKLTALEASSGANIIQLDLDSLVDLAVTNPDEFGFTNVTESCLSNAVSIVNFGAPCSNPDEYLFWDNVHPTAKAHSLIAQLAVDTLAAENVPEEPKSVPEPVSTTAILLIGSGLLLKRKQRLS